MTTRNREHITQSIYLEDLPNEMLLEILKYKNLDELSILYGTNRRIRSLVIETVKSMKINEGEKNEEVLKAIKEDNRLKIKLLLDVGFDENYLNYITPLMYGILSNRKEIVKILLDKGVGDVNGFDYAGTTPLCHAIYNNNVDLVKILINAGANVNRGNMDDDNTPLMCATNDMVNPEIVRLLIKSGAKVNTKNRLSGNTALIIACIRRDRFNAKILLDAGADITLKNREGKDALFYAKKTGNEKLIDLISKSVIQQNKLKKNTKKRQTKQRKKIKSRRRRNRKKKEKRRGYKINF